MADLISQYLPQPIHFFHRRALLAWVLGEDSTTATAAVIASDAVSAAGGPPTDQGPLAGEVARLLERDRDALFQALGQEAEYLAEAYL